MTSSTNWWSTDMFHFHNSFIFLSVDLRSFKGLKSLSESDRRIKEKWGRRVAHPTFWYNQSSPIISIIKLNISVNQIWNWLKKLFYTHLKLTFQRVKIQNLNKWKLSRDSSAALIKCQFPARCLPESSWGQRAHSIPQPCPYIQQQSMKVTWAPSRGLWHTRSAVTCCQHTDRFSSAGQRRWPLSVSVAETRKWSFQTQDVQQFPQ